EARFPRRHGRRLASHGTVSAAVGASARLALVGDRQSVVVLPLPDAPPRTRAVPRGRAASLWRRCADRSLDGSSAPRHSARRARRGRYRVGWKARRSVGVAPTVATRADAGRPAHFGRTFDRGLL